MRVNVELIMEIDEAQLREHLLITNGSEYPEGPHGFSGAVSDYISGLIKTNSEEDGFGALVQRPEAFVRGK
jgi:hypothetical protein